jgi:acetyltransferase-like isoleucine patch superfamily enzyme
MFLFLEYYLSKMIKRLHFRAIKHSVIARNVKIHAGSHIFKSCIDRFTDIGYDCKIINSNLGSFCSLGSNIVIGGPDHTVNWVSTSAVFNSNVDAIKIKFGNNEFNPFKTTTIGHDVWIGDNVLVKAGLKIGSGSIIGMGSVVTKDIPPYQIWAGNPARFIKFRFNQEMIDKLLSIEWWNWDENKISQFGNDFNNVDLFVSIVQKDKEIS